MKPVVCRAGQITDELLKRAGTNWEITLTDKDAAKLSPFSTRFPGIVREPHAGHFVQEESPDELAEAVILFLKNDIRSNPPGLAGLSSPEIPDHLLCRLPAAHHHRGVSAAMGPGTGR